MPERQPTTVAIDASHLHTLNLNIEPQRRRGTPCFRDLRQMQLPRLRLQTTLAMFRLDGNNGSWSSRDSHFSE
jgi:hypothetical protein